MILLPAVGVGVLHKYAKIVVHALSKYRVKRRVLRLPSVFDYATFRHGGEYDENDVEGAKALVRMFPIFLMSVIFGCLFSQVYDTASNT